MKFLNKINFYTILIIVFLSPFLTNAQSLVNLKNGAVVSSYTKIKINGSIKIDAGATLKLNNNSISILTGNWENNGVQLAQDGSLVIFIGNSNSTISGNGATYQFDSIVISKENLTNEVILNALISAPNGFLGLLYGTFHIIGTYTLSNTFLNSVANIIEILQNTRFWLDNPNVTVTGQNADLLLTGNLRISQGTFNIGSGTNANNLLYNSATGVKPTLEIEGGELNINARFSRNNTQDSITYTQTGGRITVGKNAISTTPNRGMFDIGSANSSIIWSGGIIEMQRPSTAGGIDDYYVQTNTYSITGGNLRINAQDPANNSFTINSSVPIGSLTLEANNNPTLTLSANLVSVDSVNLNGSGADRLVLNNFSLSLGGDWINNFASANSFNPGNQPVIFTGGNLQKIRGTQSTIFNNLSVNKSDSKVELEMPTRVNGSLRLLSDTAIIDMKQSDLTLGPNGKIYSDAGATEDILSFTKTKCIQNSGSNSDPLAGAKLIKYLPQPVTLPILLNFPLTTPGVYTPNTVEISSGGATFGPDPYIAIKIVPLEHPAVEVSNRSLKKFWNVSASNVNIQNNGATVLFYYDASEAWGNEGLYRVLVFAPAWNDPTGYWRIDPGLSDDVVEFNQKLFYSQQVNYIEGDWTAGEPDVAVAKYFARANGNYNDPNTWSKEGFGGAPATTAPNKRSDIVRIQDYTVTVTAQPPPAQIISVENGTEGRQPGKLIVQDTFYLTGDTLRVETNATLGIGHNNGITLSPIDDGNVRTSVRSFSTGAIYTYIGDSTQVTGNGLPSTIQALVVSKSPNKAVSLSQNVTITDSLIINDGILDLASATANGNSAGRVLIMRGGELIVRSSFPTNYSPPTFTVGKVTFDGTGNVTIPASGSTPGVLQYYNLKISGNTRSGNIIFPSAGEIRIKNNLDISELNFTNNTYRFITNGSTVRFNKNGGTQEIPCKPASPADSVVFLEYYNLIVDSSGTKQLVATGTPVFKVNNNLTLTNGANLVSNNHTIQIQGNWSNQSGSIFTAGTGTVNFTSPVAALTTTITSRDTTDNTFYNVIISGPGIVQPNDNIKITGNFTIYSGSTFNLSDKFMSLYGNFSNDGGTFSYGTSTVQFNGNTTQTITNSSGDLNFYNLNINNGTNVHCSQIGSSTNGIIINNNLNLNAGNLRSHIGSDYRYVRVIGNITRSGGGYVDGELRKLIPAGSSSTLFEIGHRFAYTPIRLEITGTGGTGGIIGVLSDTITTTTSPISWQGDPPTNILPLNSRISPQRHIARQYSITIPTGSTFVLGPSRKYNATFKYIPGNSPNGDFRNGLTHITLEPRLRTASDWIAPYQYTTYPSIESKSSDSLKYINNVDFGAYILGEPTTLTYYTRASGNWTCDTCWSLEGYNMSPAYSYPGQYSNTFQAYIGRGHTITLNQNITVNNSGSETGIIQVDSAGTLMCETYTISGTGTFRLAKNSAIGIGHANGIVNSPTSDGNIRTTTRAYNYNSHNTGTFIYTGTGAQNTGNGLPAGSDSISVLKVNKPSGVLTCNEGNVVHIKDSLLLLGGGYNLGTRDHYLYRYMRKSSSAVFQPNGRNVYLRGNNPITLKSDVYADSIAFYNLYILKSLGTGFVYLDTLTTIYIQNQLNFQSGLGNKAIIDATTKSSDARPLYVMFAPTATVVGAGHINATLNGGWIYGEVRKNIPAGDAPTVTFETGTETHYTPFAIDFRAGTNSVAGYLSAKALPGVHPKLYSSPQNLYPVNPNRAVLNYWRLIKPAGSTFVRGNRNVDFIVYTINPDLVTNVDCIGCCDVTFYRGGDSLQWWQGMYANTTNSNSGESGICADTRIPPHPTPNFSYSGSACSSTATLVNIRVNNVTTAEYFGSQEIYANGDTLLADFVAGNRNSIKYYNFYSIRDGNWSDPDTWSTESYTSTVNAAASDPDPLIRPVPSRQYDNVYIGNGKKVTLDMNVGTNNYSGGVNVYTFAGPSVYVEENGTLDLSTAVLRGNQFRAMKNSKLIIGAYDGIHNARGGNGNIQLGAYAPAPAYNDSIDVVYTAKGRTINRGTTALNVVNRDGTTHYLEEVTIRRASDNSIVMRYHSGNRFLVSSYCHIYIPASATLVAGETYYITVNPSNVVGTRKIRAWIDFNYNYTFTDANEPVMNVNSSDTTSVTSANFTVPASTSQGSTYMRIGINNNTSDFTPTTTGTGEFEEYTINIINPNETVYNKQSTGAGLPSILNSLTLHSQFSGATDPQLTMSKNLTIIDSLRITSGRLNAGSYTYTLYGNFINDTLNGFNPQTSTVIMQSTNKDTIRGNASINFNKLTISKLSTEPTYIKTNISLADTFKILTNNIVELDADKQISLGASALFNSGSGSFSNQRMIRLDPNSTINNIVKTFANVASPPALRQILIPVGVDTSFSSADINLRFLSTATNPTISLGIRKAKHPARLTENILNKYWTFSATNIPANTVIDSLKLRYVHDEINGDIQKYIPGRHRTGEGWEINLGPNPQAKVAGADSLIIRIVNDSTSLWGDYTIGEPLVYFIGRIFYSRNSGEWNNRLNWSNDPILKHNGRPAAYYPGMIFANDTVNIDGHTITFQDSVSLSVDSLRIGGTNPDPGQGILVFGSSPSAKTLNTRQLFIDENGLITGLASGNRQDTLAITQNLIHNSTALQSLRTNADNSTTIKFTGAGSSYLQGSGGWGALGNFLLEKSNGLSDTLFIENAKLPPATDTSGNYIFNINSGVIKYAMPYTFYLSSINSPLYMGANSGIDVTGGSIALRNSLITNTNTTIELNGGNLFVGNEQNEHLLYTTGSKITLISGTMRVAGAFARRFETSTTELTINSGEVFVNTIGNTSTDKIGFDLSNIGNTFNMNGGRIVIANAMGTSSTAFDYRINAQNGTGMIGGILQSGDTTLTPSGTTIKIGGDLPVYTLHFANNSARNVTTQITEEVFTIKGNWEIDNNHSFDLSGNTVFLGGNLTNYGNFNAIPSGPTSNPWQIVLNGSGNQTLFSNANPITLYNLRLEKTSGNVMLSDNGSSDLIIKNNLEFAIGNNSLIEANIEAGRYVEMSSITGVSNPQVIRNGLGHVSGRLYRWIETGIQNILFPVGANNIDEYRPVRFETAGNDNTAGFIGVVAHNFDHPDILDAMIDTSNNIQKYWNVYPRNVNGFALGPSRTFDLTIQFLNPDDIRNSVSPLFFEQKVYTPPCPDPPAICDGSGTWSELQPSDKTDTTNKSTGNTTFGDFIIGVPSGIVFYSRNNGNWNDINTWSLSGYEIDDPPTRIPDQMTDIVRIGNGKKVTVPDGITPTVRAIYVEKYNGIPGYLQINGNLGCVRGTTFALEDDCTLGVQHLNGIAPDPEGTRGAVQTNTRVFGVSRYIFNGSYGSQNSGSGLPDSIKAIIVDNPSSPTNDLFIYHYTGGPALKIRDTVLVKQGVLNTSNRNFTLYGVLEVQRDVNDGTINPQTGTFTFAGSSPNYIIVKNRGGVRFYNLNVAGSNVFVYDSLLSTNDTSDVVVQNTLNFQSPAHIVLEQGERPINLYIQSTSPTAIVNAGSTRFIRTSNNSGYLIRQVAPNNSYTFPIGSLDISGVNNLYAPVIFEAGSSGSNGKIGIRTSPGTNIHHPGAHKSISSSSVAEYLRRYWTIDSVTTTINGKFTFNYDNSDIVGDDNNFTKIGRWRPVKEGTPGLWQFPFIINDLDPTNNRFSTSTNFNYAEFMGDWTVGNNQAFRRIFYSRQSGLWNNDNSWTYSETHSGVIAGVGIWPDDPQDSVVIGGTGGNKHTITLNLDADIEGVAVGVIHPGIFDLSSNILTGKHFVLYEGSTLRIGSPQGISPLDSTSGNIQTNISRVFPQNATYEYNGTTDQITGLGIPDNVQNLIINNSGGTVTLSKPLTITNSLSILQGRFDLDTLPASGNGSATFDISANGILRIKGIKNLKTSLDNYSTYNFDVLSTTEFSGTDQIISDIPINLINGLGNVIAENNGIKKVEHYLLVKGNFTNRNSNFLEITGPNLLEVRKNVINSATIFNNNGIIEIGE